MLRIVYVLGNVSVLYGKRLWIGQSVLRFGFEMDFIYASAVYVMLSYAVPFGKCSKEGTKKNYSILIEFFFLSISRCSRLC